MPESQPSFVGYATKYSKDAQRARSALPPAIQVKLLDVIDQLADDPDAFTSRTRAIGREGNIYIYSHPVPALEITYELDRNAKVLFLLHFAAPVIELAKPVFISYSHEDVEWLKKLKQFLKPLEQQDLIRVWDDTEIKPGAVWFDEIKQSLTDAKVAILLITQNFLTSEFISNKELPPLLQSAKDRGVLVLWIAVSSSTVEDTPISDYQAANDPKTPLDTLPEPQQNRVLTEIYEKVKEAVKTA